MELSPEDKEYLKIFSAAEYLKNSINEKNPIDEKNRKYFTLQRRNPYNKDLIESYLLLEMKNPLNTRIFTNIFNYFFPLQSVLDCNKILAMIRQGLNKEGDLKNYIKFFDKNYKGLESACQETCNKFNIFMPNPRD